MDYAKGEGKQGSVFFKWLKVIKSANVSNSNDLLQLFSYTDTLGKGSKRFCFNIGGNNYRMICKVVFGRVCHMFVCWIGTHPEYDWICKEGRQYTINDF